MDWYLILMVAAVVGLSLLSKWLNAPKPSRYKQRNALLSPAERSFFGVLQKAVSKMNAESSESNYQLFAKVRIADVLAPDHKANSKTWWRAFAKITQKHFDFVLCDATSMKVVMAIELDDKSHQTKKIQERDALVEAACSSADLPLARFQTKRAYSITEIECQLVLYLNPEQLGAPKEAI